MGPCHQAWCVLRLRLEERPPMWKVAANILNKQSRTADKRWSSSSGLGEILTTTHRKNCMVKNCNMLVKNARAPTEEKSDYSKWQFHEDLKRGFNLFPKYHIKILSGDCNTSLRRQVILKTIIRNDSLHLDSTDNNVRIVKFATSKNLAIKSTMFPHRNIHKYTWTSPDGKTHDQSDHMLLARRWHSGVLDVRYFRGADCHTDHRLVGAEVRERLAVSKQTELQFDVERFKSQEAKWAGG